MYRLATVFGLTSAQPTPQGLSGAPYLPYIKNRADNVMKIWEQRNDADAVNSIINEVFGKYPDGTLITGEMINEVSEKVSQYLVEKFENNISSRTNE